MKINVSGYGDFEHSLSVEEYIEISNKLMKNNYYYNQPVLVSRDGFDFNDAFSYDLDVLTDFLKAHNNGFKEGIIVIYNGDYCGAMRWESGQWVDYEANPLCDFTNQELIKELRYRGIHVGKE